MRTLAPRVLAWLVVFSLIVPRPALALREQATPEKDPKTLAGLEEALKDPDKALRQLTQLVTSPRSHSDPAVPPVVVPATSLTGLEEVPDLSRIMPQIRAGDPGLDPDLLEWIASLGQSISSHAPVVFQELVAGYRRSVPVEELKSEAELGRPPRYFYSLGSFEGSLLKALWEREGQINRALQVYLARRIFTRATELHRRPTFTAKPLKTRIPKEQISALLESGLIRLVQVEGAKWGLTPVSFVLLPAEGVQVSQIRAQLRKLSGGLPTDRPLSTGLEEQGQPVKLTWRAWWAALGAWGPTKGAFEKFSREAQGRLYGQVYRLVNRLVDPSFRHTRAWAEHLERPWWRTGRTAYARMLLQRDIPAAARTMTDTQLQATLDLALRSLEIGKSPEGFLLNLAALARLLPSDRFAILVDSAARGLERADPSEFYDFYLPHGDLAAISEVARTPEEFQTGVGLLKAFHLSARKELGLFRSDTDLVPAVIRASRTPADLEANLKAFERFLAQLRREGADAPRRLFQESVSAAARLSSTPQEFQENLDVVLQVFLQLHTQKLRGRFTLLAEIAKSSASSERLRADYRAFVERVPSVQRLEAAAERLRDARGIFLEALQSIAWRLSATEEQFGEYMQLLERTAVTLERLQWTAASSVGQALRALGDLSWDPESFRIHLGAFEDLLRHLLAVDHLNWEEVSAQELVRLATEAAEYYRQKTGYRAEVQFSNRVRQEWQDEHWVSDYSRSPEPAGWVERTYLVQEIRLIPGETQEAGLEELGGLPRLPVLAPVEKSRFPSAQQTGPVMRFVVDTSGGESRVLHFAQWAVLLDRAGLPIRFAGVATADELTWAQAVLPDEASRRMLADHVQIYDPVDESGVSYSTALALAQMMVFEEQASPAEIRRLTLREYNPGWVQWFLRKLDQLGIQELFEPAVRERIEASLTAA